MRKALFLLPILMILAVLHFHKVSAWTYDISGSAVCQTDGTNKLTWVIDNTVEPEALNITASNRAVVPVGTQVPAHQTGTFTESVPGTSGSFTLTVSGNFPSDRTIRTRTATVATTDCPQPPVVVPPTPPTPPVVPPTPPLTPFKGK